jgi:hypothetical protein
MNTTLVHYDAQWRRPDAGVSTRCGQPLVPGASASRIKRHVNCPECRELMKLEDDNFAAMEAAERRWPRDIR